MRGVPLVSQPTSSDVHVEGASGNAKRRKAKLFSEVRKYASPGVPHPHQGNRTGRNLRRAGAGGFKPRKPGGGIGSQAVRRIFGGGGSARAKPFGKLQENKMAEDIKKFVKAESIQPELGLVFGWAIICKDDEGRDYYDVQGDHIPEESMLKAAADFMAQSRMAKEMHSGDQRGSYLFCWPVTGDIGKAMGIHSKRTGLMIGYAPPPEVLEKFKSGHYTGFSIGGSRIRDEEIAG